MPTTIPATCTENPKAAKRWAAELKAGKDCRRVSGKTIATAITLGLVREVVETETVAPSEVYPYGRTIVRRRYEAV